MFYQIYNYFFTKGLKHEWDDDSYEDLMYLRMLVRNANEYVIPPFIDKDNLYIPVDVSKSQYYDYIQELLQCLVKFIYENQLLMNFQCTPVLYRLMKNTCIKYGKGPEFIRGRIIEMWLQECAAHVFDYQSAVLPHLLHNFSNLHTHALYPGTCNPLLLKMHHFSVCTVPYGPVGSSGFAGSSGLSGSSDLDSYDLTCINPQGEKRTLKEIVAQLYKYENGQSIFKSSFYQAPLLKVLTQLVDEIQG